MFRAVESVPARVWSASAAARGQRSAPWTCVMSVAVLAPHPCLLWGQALRRPLGRAPRAVDSLLLAFDR